MSLYGKKMSIATSVLNLICLLGFTMSYIVYLKSLMPVILNLFLKGNFPSWLGGHYAPDPKGGDPYAQVFWGTVLTFGYLFPISLPRQINQLRFTSVLGVLCSLYLGFIVFFIFWLDKDLVPNPSHNWDVARYGYFSYTSIVSSFPLIIFAYMY